jgi:hypothetical protein
MSNKTFLTICIVLLLGIVSHRLFGADWFDYGYIASSATATNGQYGLYVRPTTNDSPVYAGFFSLGTNIVFDASVLPNPCFLSVNYQVGANKSDFSEWIYFNTNDYAAILGAPSFYKIKRHKGL